MKEDESFLSELTKNFKRREKSYRRKGYEVEFQKIVNSESNMLEATEIHIRTSRSRDSSRLHVKIWEDRWVFFDMRQLSKTGWDWELHLDGRYVGPDEALGLVRSIEITAQKLWQAKKYLKKIETHWSQILANGPKDISSGKTRKTIS